MTLKILLFKKKINILMKMIIILIFYNNFNNSVKSGLRNNL
jgi:hypothetical protein